MHELKKNQEQNVFEIKKKKGYWRYLSEEHEIGRKMGIGSKLCIGGWDECVFAKCKLVWKWKDKKKKGILSSEGKNKGAKMKRQMALEGQKNREKIRLHSGN